MKKLIVTVLFLCSCATTHKSAAPPRVQCMYLCGLAGAASFCYLPIDKDTGKCRCDEFTSEDTPPIPFPGEQCSKVE